MRGTVRLAAIGMAIGLIFAALAPTSASAVTPISIFDDFRPFPDNVVGESPLSGRGIVVASDRNGSSLTAIPFENNLEEVGNQLPAASFGLIVAARQLGFEIFPFAKGGNAGENSNPSDEAPAETPVGGPSGSATPPAFEGGDSVGTAPEPATWIMMIVGFGIAAWRLRSLRQEGPGAVPA